MLRIEVVAARQGEWNVGADVTLVDNLRLEIETVSQIIVTDVLSEVNGDFCFF